MVLDSFFEKLERERERFIEIVRYYEWTALSFGGDGVKEKKKVPLSQTLGCFIGGGD